MDSIVMTCSHWRLYFRNKQYDIIVILLAQKSLHSFYFDTKNCYILWQSKTEQNRDNKCELEARTLDRVKVKVGVSGPGFIRCG
jgi:predicted RNA-binding protein associated with RNAse of E/G family